MMYLHDDDRVRDGGGLGSDQSHWPVAPWAYRTGRERHLGVRMIGADHSAEVCSRFKPGRSFMRMVRPSSSRKPSAGRRLRLRETSSRTVPNSAARSW